jgi:peptide/nickel transport system permease protein
MGMAIAAPVLAPPDDPAQPLPLKVVGNPLDGSAHPPSPESLLGTVPGQFDVYYTLIWGARTALLFGLTVASSAALIGVIVGAVSGYVGGRFNQSVMRLTDALLSFPVIAVVRMFAQIIVAPDFQQAAFDFEPMLFIRVA